MARQKEIFLVAKYYKQPRDKTQTSVKGYMKDDENISYSESVTLAHGLKDRDLTANIILNLTTKTVVKCNFETKNGWNELAEYYAKNYPEYMKIADPEPASESIEEDKATLIQMVKDKIAEEDGVEDLDPSEKG